MTDLDDPSLLALDRADMLGHIRTVGAELVRAWAQSEELRLPDGAPGATAIVLAGMGGSATAADYFAAICARTAELPVSVVRGYAMPNHVSERTLVVVCSYSGNTEEALSCYDDAWKRDAMLLAITRGGALAARAAADGVPVHPIRYDAQPRATTVHTLAPLLRMGARLGLCAASHAAVIAAADVHRALVESDLAPSVAVTGNGAKQLASALVGRFPLVFGAEHLAPAAVRFRNQLAENGKALAAAESLPEANHNLVVGLATARNAAPTATAVMLDSPALYDHRVAKRFHATARLLQETGIPVHRIEVSGETVLEQLLSATAWGDFVSFYLALANGMDPTPVPQIDRLKRELA